MPKQDMIYEDFMEDRAIKMFKDADLNYFVYVQVFTTDNLPFSPLTGDKKHIFFDYDQASTADVTVSGVCGEEFNQTTQRYEVTDHTFVIGKVVKQSLPEETALQLMNQAARNIIAQLSKRIPMPMPMRKPHIMTDVERCNQLLSDENVDLGELSKQTGIDKEVLINYRENPDLLKDASNADVNKLATKYFDTFFSRNEIERFRFMLINVVDAYLKEVKGNTAEYDPAYELYMMCQKGDWHALAKMEEMWRAMYSSH
ncbi:MAG: XRE family transcriptional regulator [Lactobacillus sp.]